MEVGSIAELLSALGGLLALVAAAIAARAAVRTNNQQGRQLAQLEAAEAERRQTAEAAQASRVAVWVELETGSGRPRVQFANPSGLPIYGATALVHAGARRVEVRYSILAPRDGTSRLPRVEAALEQAQQPDDPSWATLLDSGRLGAALTFRDAQALWWLRDTDGGLTSHPSEGAARRALNIPA